MSTCVIPCEAISWPCAAISRIRSGYHCAISPSTKNVTRQSCALKISSSRRVGCSALPIDEDSLEVRLRPWSVVMRYALSALYSHPWAWNEIGFGGPAYPRGYMRMGVGDHVGRDPHEAEEAFQRDPVRES